MRTGILRSSPVTCILCRCYSDTRWTPNTSISPTFVLLFLDACSCCCLLLSQVPSFLYAMITLVTGSEKHKTWAVVVSERSSCGFKSGNWIIKESTFVSFPSNITIKRKRANSSKIYVYLLCLFLFWFCESFCWRTAFTWNIYKKKRHTHLSLRTLYHLHLLSPLWTKAALTQIVFGRVYIGKRTTMIAIITQECGQDTAFIMASKIQQEYTMIMGLKSSLQKGDNLYFHFLSYSDEWRRICSSVENIKFWFSFVEERVSFGFSYK